jgi:hypothetical protein
MAMVKAPFGKQKVAGGSEGFISGALRGNTGGEGQTSGWQNSSTSNEIKDYPVDRPDQKIKTAFAMDNVGRVYGRPMTSIKDQSFPGGVDNIAHSLTGSSAVNEEVGAKGKLKHVIIPNH